MRNLHQLTDWQYIGQMIGRDFAKFCGHLRIYELYEVEIPTYAPCINFYQTQSSFQSASPRSLLIHCAEANADVGDVFEAGAEL